MALRRARRAVAATVSSVFSRRRASPSASAINISRAAGSSSRRSRKSLHARSMRACNSASCNGSSTYTDARESSAPITSNDGFSVVAPTNTNSPDSTCGRKASCCALLKRCTSSTNTTVDLPSRRRLACARSTASRMSFTPPSTAEIATKSRPKASAISRASVVLPTPGGPHRIIECGRPDSNATRSGLPGPSRCAWPITSSMVRGRMRSARGALPGCAAVGFSVANKSSLMAHMVMTRAARLAALHKGEFQMAERDGGPVRAILYALGANAGIAVTKFGAAAYTGSGAMLAEAIHSLADCANQLLLLLGMRQARRPETAEHPLGYERVVYFWAMMVALLLFLVGGLFSIYEGVERIRHPESMSNHTVALVVLAVAIVLEAISLMGAMREIRKVRGTRPFLTWFRETRQSEL